MFGKASGFAANLNLSSLDGSTGFKLSGVAPTYETFGDCSGYSVASAGDVNGDGFDDLIIGAPLANILDGASYVVFGKASGFTASLYLGSLDWQRRLQAEWSAIRARLHGNFAATDRQSHDRPGFRLHRL